jgi:hypothetical protein
MEITPSSAEVTFIPQNTKRPNENPNTFHSALLIQIPLQVCQSNSILVGSLTYKSKKDLYY